VLPGRPWLAQQLDASLSQFLDGRWQVTDGETGNWAGREMLLSRVAAAEDLDMAAIRQLEDPEIRFRMYQSEAENMFVEVRQFPGAIRSRAAPAKACDLHTVSNTVIQTAYASI